MLLRGELYRASPDSRRDVRLCSHITNVSDACGQGCFPRVGAAAVTFTCQGSAGMALKLGLGRRARLSRFDRNGPPTPATQGSRRDDRTFYAERPIAPHTVQQASAGCADACVYPIY